MFGNKIRFIGYLLRMLFINYRNLNLFFIPTQASNMVKVDAVVCLGFPMSDRETCTAKFNVPTLFFIGERDRSCSVKRLEKFRSSFRSTTGLVVVGGANGQLRMSHSRQLVEQVLQPMVDRCIVVSS